MAAAAAATLIDPITADFVAAMELSETDSEHRVQVGNCACVYTRAVNTASGGEYR